MKILITGGHLTPALALIEKLKSDFGGDNQIIFVGRKYALDSEQNLSLEYKEVTNQNIKFIPIKAGRLTRLITLDSLKSLLKIPLGFYQAYDIIKRNKPDVIMCFGGYIALPIAIVSKLYGIPIYTHEQTINPGISNRIIGQISERIFVSFDETKKFFDIKKTVVTGNLLRPAIFSIIKQKFVIKKTRPVIYVTGGSLGAHAVNTHIEKILRELLTDYIVIHQTGDVSEYGDYARLMSMQKEMPNELGQNYYLTNHLMADEIGYIYSVADMLIARAGANTFFEAIALEKPTIFIPLPWSANNEQERHAEIFREKKLGEIFNQSDDSSKLLTMIRVMISNIKDYRQHFQDVKNLHTVDAAQTICNVILKKNITS